MAKAALETLPGVREVTINYEAKEGVLLMNKNAEINDTLVKKALETITYDGYVKTNKNNKGQ